jgi:hypothetical protein
MSRLTALNDYDCVISSNVVEDVRRLLSADWSSSVWHDSPPPQSILDLDGLGKEVWLGIEATNYVRVLRDEWDAR